MRYVGATSDILLRRMGKNDWLLGLVFGFLAAIAAAFFLSSNVEATLSEICARYDTNGDGEVDVDGVMASVDDFNAGLITYEDYIAVIDCFYYPDDTPTPVPPTPTPTATATATPTPTPTGTLTPTATPQGCGASASSGAQAPNCQPSAPTPTPTPSLNCDDASANSGSKPCPTPTPTPVPTWRLLLLDRHPGDLTVPNQTHCMTYTPMSEYAIDSDTVTTSDGATHTGRIEMKSAPYTSLPGTFCIDPRSYISL